MYNSIRLTEEIRNRIKNIQRIAVENNLHYAVVVWRDCFGCISMRSALFEEYAEASIWINDMICIYKDKSSWFRIE